MDSDELTSWGASLTQPLRNTPFGHPSHNIAVATHEHIAHVLAAILVYLYIFLSLTTGIPLWNAASTRALHRRALSFALFELLLICGVNESTRITFRHMSRLVLYAH